MLERLRLSMRERVAARRRRKLTPPAPKAVSRTCACGAPYHFPIPAPAPWTELPATMQFHCVCGASIAVKEDGQTEIHYTDRVTGRHMIKFESEYRY